LSDLPKSRALLVKQLRILILALRGFVEDKCQIRASALTFYSLLSVVPLIAMLFGVAKGFGFEQLLEDQIKEKLAENQEMASLIVDFSNNLLENTSGGLIAGVGVAILFWSVIKLLGNIEVAFNDIWKIKQHRKLYRKFSDYLSIMLVAPILLVASSSVMVFIATQTSKLIERVAILGPIGSVLFFLLRLLPLVLIWILFTMIYVVMPNTKVKIKSGLFAGVAAGTIYVVVQNLYIRFQIGVSSANAIYGSFAALPLLLAWLQLSWMIVLIGTELSHTFQSIGNFEFRTKELELSSFNKKRLSLLISHLVVEKFSKGEEALTAPQIKDTLGMPLSLVSMILDELVESKILSTTELEGSDEVVYQPARGINSLTISHVVKALDKRGSAEMPTPMSIELRRLTRSLDRFNELIDKSDENILLKDL
jgi:membrane protein